MSTRLSPPTTRYNVKVALSVLGFAVLVLAAEDFPVGRVHSAAAAARRVRRAG